MKWMCTCQRRERRWFQCSEFLPSLNTNDWSSCTSDSQPSSHSIGNSSNRSRKREDNQSINKWLILLLKQHLIECKRDRDCCQATATSQKSRFLEWSTTTREFLVNQSSTAYLKHHRMQSLHWSSSGITRYEKQSSNPHKATPNQVRFSLWQWIEFHSKWHSISYNHILILYNQAS